MKALGREKVTMGDVRKATIPCAGDYYNYSQVILTTPNLLVTDPCYNPQTWCQHRLTNMKLGKYDVGCKVLPDKVTNWGNRVSEIFIVHEDFGLDESITHADFVQVEGAGIGVDSGQAGFFATEQYEALWPEGEKESPVQEAFYKEICDITLEDFAGRYRNWGYVSSSGFGDGGYPLYIIEREGKVIAAKVVFISEDDLKESEDE